MERKPDYIGWVAARRRMPTDDGEPSDEQTGARPGTSYLVYRASAITTADGQTVNAQVRASRVVIK